MPTKRHSTSKPAAAKRARGISYDEFRKLALRLPGVEVGTSYGTPALKVKGKLLTRLWEDGETLVLLTTFFDRDHLMQAEPATFYITDHYKGYPTVLVRLANVRPAQLLELFEDNWRRVAPKILVTAHGASRA